jgi:hypothetical protein
VAPVTTTRIVVNYPHMPGNERRRRRPADTVQSNPEFARREPWVDGASSRTRRLQVAENPIEIQRYLKGVDYPVTKGDLISHAEDNDAPDEAIEQLQAMNEEQFDGPEEVMEALGAS